MRGCAILLPAAGGASRMRGVDKLLMQVANRPLIAHVARQALSASAHVAVTLRPEDTARNAALGDLPLTRLRIPEASEGMAASFRAAASWAMRLPVQALMIVLPDMPEITAADMRALIEAQAAHPGKPLRASDIARKPGHPVILPRAVFSDLLSLAGDTGAREVLRRYPPRLHALPGQRALRDLDTPEDWAAWRGQPS